VSVDGVGCFGQEVLVGLRRRRTTVASSHLELLILEKASLLQLFADAENNADVRRLCVALLDSFMKRERLRRFRAKASRAAARTKGDIEAAAAWHMHLCWERYTDTTLRSTDKLYRLISAKPGAMTLTVRPAEDGSADSKSTTAAAIDDLRHKQEAMMAATLALQKSQLDMQTKQDAILAHLARLNGEAPTPNKARVFGGKPRASLSAGGSPLAV
jgi:hypothetical protein